MRNLNQKKILTRKSPNFHRSSCMTTGGQNTQAVLIKRPVGINSTVQRYKKAVKKEYEDAKICNNLTR